MTQERVLDFLSKNGEKINADIKLEGLPAKRIAGILAKLFNLKQVTRRQVTHNSKLVWCYSVTNSAPLEPDYAYILRNLPRKPNERHGEPSTALHIRWD
jgi:hypothetical protein